jgi:hypothetical protein
MNRQTPPVGPAAKESWNEFEPGVIPSFEAQLSKLGAIFKKAKSPPRITARRGGRAIKKISRSVRFREAGVVFRSTGQGTPPRRRR